MKRRWRSGGLILIGSLMMWACTQSKPQQAMTTTTNASAGSSSIKASTENYALTRQDQVKRKIEQSIQTIHRRVKNLQSDLDKSQEEIDVQALAKSKKLEQDMKRLQESLQQTLDSINNSSAEEYRRMQSDITTDLEKAEDEMAQINEELNEWYDNNLN